MPRAMIDRNWIAVMLWMAFIFWMSSDTFSSQHTSTIIEPILRYLKPSASEREITMIHDVIRKAAHVTEYFILGLLLFRAFRGRHAERGVWRSALYSLLVVALYAASDEFHQTFLASRTPSLRDVGLDTLGGFIAQCINMIRHHRRR